jgi:hypothetical protein
MYPAIHSKLQREVGNGRTVARSHKETGRISQQIEAFEVGREQMARPVVRLWFTPGQCQPLDTQMGHVIGILGSRRYSLGASI